MRAAMLGDFPASIFRIVGFPPDTFRRGKSLLRPKDGRGIGQENLMFSAPRREGCVMRGGVRF